MTSKKLLDFINSKQSFAQKELLEFINTPIVTVNLRGIFIRVNGRLHKTNGPAYEYADGTKEWYVDDTELTESEFNDR